MFSAMQRALRLARLIGQWLFLAGALLAALGLLGSVLSLFHIRSSFLVNLGIVALLLFFLSSLLFFLAMVLQRVIARRAGRR